MLTFEKVLDIFKNYLADDDMYEIVMTSHGYTVMEWDGRLGDWADSRLCKTPQDMADILLSGYETRFTRPALRSEALRTFHYIREMLVKAFPSPDLRCEAAYTAANPCASTVNCTRVWRTAKFYS